MFKEKSPPLSLIVAVDKDGGFGKDGKIPWHFTEDLKHFQETTKGGVCIMGRHTYTDMYEMIQSNREEVEKANPILHGRESYVVTSKPDIVIGAIPVKSIHAATQMLKKGDDREVFVLGGYRMYVEALAYTQTIYMTVVKGKSYDCDRFFPIEVLNKKFKIVEGRETDDLNFLTYKRIK